MFLKIILYFKAMERQPAWQMDKVAKHRVRIPPKLAKTLFRLIEALQSELSGGPNWILQNQCKHRSLFLFQGDIQQFYPTNMELTLMVDTADWRHFAMFKVHSVTDSHHKITVWISFLQDMVLKPVQQMDSKQKVLRYMCYKIHECSCSYCTLKSDMVQL